MNKNYTPTFSNIILTLKPTMKFDHVIPKKGSRHSQGKAYFSIKPIEWDKEKDKQVRCKPPSVKQGKSAGLEKILYQIKDNEAPEKFILWVKD